MKKLLKIIFIIFLSFCLLSFISAQIVLAATPTPSPTPAKSPTTSPTPKTGATTPSGGAGSAAATAPAGTGATTLDISGIKGPLGAFSPSTLIGNIIKTVLSIVGALALLMVVYGGMILLTSRGGEGVKKGKDILIWATIGVAVVLGSYALVSYVITGISGGGGGGAGGEGGTTTPSTCSAMGGTCFGVTPCNIANPEDVAGCAKYLVDKGYYASCSLTATDCSSSVGKACCVSKTITTSACMDMGGTCKIVTPCNIDNPNDVASCAKYLQDTGIYKSCAITEGCDSNKGYACCVNK